MLSNAVKILISLLLVVDLYVLIFLNVNPNSLSLNLGKKEEKITELYFPKHLELPKSIETDRDYAFQFTTRNLENTDIDYAYTVYIELNDVRFLIDQGAFKLGHNSEKTQAVSFRINDSFEEGRVVVLLNNRNQQINFKFTES